jgi:amidase
MQSKDVGSRDATSSGTTRRRFLGSSLAGGAALLAGKWSSVLQARVSPAQDDGVWIEASIQQLQALMASGELTSRELTRGYIHRIGSLNPLLGAVIEINPEAGATAARRDNERRSGHIRGPLHGIPILLKDNIATADTMQTTAGSLALVNSRVPADAPIVERLRAAGAVILGKANLSEWANFRGFAPFNGWSARGSFTRCPYLLDFDPCGSSSGSGVAPAANLCAGAVGTETDGSIVCPAGNNLVVGLKPTLGLLSQDGIIPIGHSQDTAGPMARTVRDVAIMLSVMQTPFGPALGHALPSDYTTFLQRGALSGARIGVDERYFTSDYGGEPDLIAVVQKGFDAMEALGATLVPTDSGDPFAYFGAEFTVLLVEFKVHIAEYLATLDHTSMRTLADLIAFNIAHCPNEMKYFGQELFEISESTNGDLSDPLYLAARAHSLQSAGVDGIDAAMVRDDLDAIVAPTYSFASSPAAVAGYPNISVPIGLTPEGKPAGIWMYSGFLREPELLAFAYDLEQEIQPRSQPEFLGSVPEAPADAEICEALPKKPHVFSGKAHLPHHLGTGKPFRR